MVLGEVEAALGSRVLRGDERDELLALLSHELRTPLAPLGGFVATVLEHHADQLGPDADRLLRIAARNASRLQRTVDRVLLTIRAVSADDVVFEDVPLAAVVADALGDAEQATEVEVDVAAGLTVATGREHLRLLLRELVDNALLHGAAPVTITARPAGGSVELRVTDSGPGVDPAFSDRMFEGFTQHGPMLRRDHGGLGLGLRLAAGLADVIGADLRHEPGPGATFVVTLPPALVLPSPVEAAGPDGDPDVAALRLRRAVASAHHRMSFARSREDVRATLSGLVSRSGARFVGVDDVDPDTIALDLAVGAGPPMFAAATGSTRTVLERHLPGLVALGEAVLSRRTDRHFTASQVVDLLAVQAVAPVRRDLEDRYRRGQSISRIIDEVVAPALHEIGHRWEVGVWTVAEQQAATELLESLVAPLELQLRTETHHGPRVTIVGVPGEGHTLPSRLLVLELLDRDVEVRWIGGSTPPGAIGRDLAKHGAEALLLSCSFAPLLGGTIDVARRAAAEGVPVVLGGNAVRRHPRLAAATGCIVAPRDLAAVVDLLQGELEPPAPVRHLGDWQDRTAAVRHELDRRLDAPTAGALASEELRWLGEAIALVQWQPQTGGPVLDEALRVLARGLLERGESMVDMPQLTTVATELAGIG